MEAGTTVLRDIHGLDAIPWLPLAPGWWYLAGLVGLLLLLIATRYWLIYKTGWLGWRGDAYRQLRELKRPCQVKTRMWWPVGCRNCCGVLPWCAVGAVRQPA